MNKFNYNEYLKLRDYYEKRVGFISSIRLIIFIMIVISFFISSSYYGFIYVGIVLVISFIILIFIHDIYYKKLDYYKRYIIILDEYKERFNGGWKEFSDRGDEYNNNFFNDLDIVGNNSLFQFLSVCKTKGSRDKLIKRLSNCKVSKRDILSNQEIIYELSRDISFDVDFQVGMYNFRDKDISLNDGVNGLDINVGFRRIDLLIGIICSLSSFILLILGIFRVISINYFYGMFVFNFMVCYMYSYIYNGYFDNINMVSSLYSKLNDVYRVILNCNFKCKGLSSIYDDVSDSYEMVKKLEFIDNLNNLKNNILSSFIFNGMFCVNIIVMYMYSMYQKEDALILKKGINDIEDLEVYISLANMGIVNDNVCMPDVIDDVNISFKNIRHPLLNSKISVGNDFNSSNGVNIITGSNMGGKTTFIRTIGINLVLMNAGSFVCADSFSSCYFKIFTSISVSDDIDKGISTFYVELLRINEAIKYKGGARIILVDEIFKGTNYNDRIYGAISVINKLCDDRTILFVTTHDFELCDIDNSNVNNYYVKEYYEDDIIKFDYKIRKGKCNSTNAKYLMKKLNIID